MPVIVDVGMAGLEIGFDQGDAYLVNRQVLITEGQEVAEDAGLIFVGLNGEPALGIIKVAAGKLPKAHVGGDRFFDLLALLLPGLPGPGLGFVPAAGVPTLLVLEFPAPQPRSGIPV